jgi:hypothetical protein
MPKFRCELLIEYPANTGRGQIETVIAEGVDATEAHANAVLAYTMHNDDETASAAPYGTPALVE